MAKKIHLKTGSKKLEEKVMVVRREDIFRWGIWNGIQTENLKKYINLISTKHKFLPRAQVETDPSWQQIIPYLIFENKGRIFVMKRKSDHTDSRLADLYSIGVGGHLNKRDVSGKDINVWVRREFEEEVKYEGKFKTNFLGLLNHDANDVGLVHIGLVIQVIGETDKIEIRDEHKSGELTKLADVGKFYKRMETWSQIVYDYLLNNMKKLQKPHPGN
jgi:predicted NUDIX family phosphoesterase